MSSAVLTVEKFLEMLCKNARYDVQGEKPIAVIAVLKFLNQKKVVGLPLSKLFTTYRQNIREEFKDLAKRYGRIKDPNSSFGIMLKELMKKIEENPEVDKAFSELTVDDIKQLYDKYMGKLQSSVIEKPQVKEVTPSVTVPVTKTKILGTELTGEFYLLIRDFELNIRDFIIEMLGKGWIKRLENEIPHMVDKWKKRQNEDDEMGIEPEKNLINYADIADYEQIMRRYKKVFFESEEKLFDIIGSLRDLARYGRNPLMHFRTLTEEGYHISKGVVKKLEKYMKRMREHRAQNQNPVNEN